MFGPNIAMVQSADPLLNDPKVMAWAEKFYAVQSWTLPDLTQPVDVELEQKRQTLLAELNGIEISGQLSSGARRGFAGGRKALDRAIRACDALSDLEPLRTEVEKLASDVQAQTLVAVAREASQTALKTAQEGFGAVRDALDRGGFSYMEQALGKLKSAFASAVDAPAYDKARKDAEAYMLLVAEAKAYGQFFDGWVRASLLLAQTLEPADKPAALAERETLLKQAETKSSTGDFAAARQALEGWKSQLGDEGALVAAVEFDARLTAYHREHHTRCERILASPLRDAKGFSHYLKDAERLAFGQMKFTEATAKIDALIAYATKARLNLGNYLRGFDQSEFRTNNPLLLAFNAAQQTQEHTGQNDPAKALKALTSWAKKNPDVMGKSLAQQVSHRLAAKYEGLLHVLGEPELSDLKATWAEHEKLVGEQNFDATNGAPKLHDHLDELFKLQTVVDQRREMAMLLVHYPAAAVFDCDKKVNTLIHQKKYKEACAAVPEALDRLRAMPDFLAALDLAQAVLAQLPVEQDGLTEPLKAQIATARAAAHDNPAAASDALRDELNKAAYLDLALALSDYRARLAQIEKLQAGVLKFVDSNKIQSSFSQGLQAAKDKADTDKDFSAAYLLLERHGAVLEEGRAMATARRQVLGVLAALGRAKTPSAQLQPHQAALTQADALAEKLEIGNARKAYEALRNNLKTLCVAAAEGYENGDEVDSNAGHSLARHGPDVDDDALKLRLTSGRPPGAKTDDERSFTGASSKFESPQDWLAGRELAAEAAEAAGVDLDQSAMVFTPDLEPAPRDAIDFTVEHGRPIDKAFLGRKKHQRLDANSGKVTNEPTYETYEEVEGLTRAVVNFMWQPDALPAETIGVDENAKHFEKMVVHSNDEYFEAYKERYNSEPPSIPGRWVMMQQYPLAEGWDNDLKAYVGSAPDNLIPK